MKKMFEQPTLTVEQFRIADAVMLSGWMQFDNGDEKRSFATLNGFATNRDNNTRLG